MIGGFVSPWEMCFFDSISFLVLNRWVKEGTVVGPNNILDLVLTTEMGRTGDMSLLEPFSRCCHYLVVFKYVLQFTSETENKVVEK